MKEKFYTALVDRMEKHDTMEEKAKGALYDDTPHRTGTGEYPPAGARR